LQKKTSKKNAPGRKREAAKELSLKRKRDGLEIEIE